jgi:hypothetical protein
MLSREFKISGPGITRAAQEAKISRRELYVVPVWDNKGRLVRVGYFLSDGSSDLPKKKDIKWFNKQEIEVHISNKSAPLIGQAKLVVDYTDNTRQSEKKFMLEIPLDKNNELVFRNLFRIKRDSTSDFMIQVEIKSRLDGKKKYRPVVRYDCAHGSIHRDLLVSRKHKEKTELPSQQQSDAIPLVIEDIKKHLSEWLKLLGWDMISEAIKDNPEIAQEMEKVKCKLLELYENPELISSKKSQLVQYR